MSHHNMATFFSGTDIDTLRKEGNQRNCFVSLIVNNAGTYSAAVTRKVQTKSEVTVRSLGKSYEFFGDGEVSMAEENQGTVTKEVSTEVIQYFMLDVERETTENPMAYLDERFKEIEEQKRREREKFVRPLGTSRIGKDSHTPWGSDDYWEKEPAYSTLLKDTKELMDNAPQKLSTIKVEEPSLWDEDTMRSLEVRGKGGEPDPNLIDRAVAQMLTCSLNINVEKFDIDAWVNKYLNMVYDRLFKTDYAGIYSPFEIWVDFITDFLVTNFPYDGDPMEYDENMYYGKVAEAMVGVLEPYRSNHYIAKYCKALESFLF